MNARVILYLVLAACVGGDQLCQEKSVASREYLTILCCPTYTAYYVYQQLSWRTEDVSEDCKSGGEQARVDATRRVVGAVVVLWATLRW